MENYTESQINKMAEELQNEGVFIGGLTDEGIVFWYLKKFGTK